MAGCTQCKKVNAMNNALSLSIRTGFLSRHIRDEDVIGGISIKKSVLNDLYYKHFTSHYYASRGACNHSLSEEDFSKIRTALAADRSALFDGELDPKVCLERLMWLTLGFPLQIQKYYQEDEYSPDSDRFSALYYSDEEGSDEEDVYDDVAQDARNNARMLPRMPSIVQPEKSPKVPRYCEGLNSFEYRWKIQSWEDISQIKFSTVLDAVRKTIGYEIDLDHWVEIASRDVELFRGDDGGFKYFKPLVPMVECFYGEDDVPRGRWTPFKFDPHKDSLRIQVWECEAMAGDRRVIFESYTRRDRMEREMDEMEDDMQWQEDGDNWSGWFWQGWPDWSGNSAWSYRNDWQNSSSSRQWTSRSWRGQQ